MIKGDNMADETDLEIFEMMELSQLERFNSCTETIDYDKEELKSILDALVSNTLGYDDNVEEVILSNLPLSGDLNYIVYGLMH